jgi:hypothetical protein
MILRKPYLSVATVVEEETDIDSNGGTGGGQRRQRRWHMRWPTSTVAVVTGGVESGRDLESFRMKSKMTRGGQLFIGSKISEVILN